MISLFTLFFCFIFVLGACYYTFMFGVSIWKKEKNKLGGFGSCLLAIAAALFSLITLIIRATK